MMMFRRSIGYHVRKSPLPVFAESRAFDAAVESQEKAINLVRTGKTLDIYTEQQKLGMTARLKLYQRKTSLPHGRLGSNSNQNVGHQSLRRK